MNFLVGVIIALFVLIKYVTRGIKKALIFLILVNITASFLNTYIAYYFGVSSTNYINALPAYLNLVFLILVFIKYGKTIMQGKFTIPIIIYVLIFFVSSFLGSGSISSSFTSIIFNLIFISLYFYGLVYFENANEKQIARFFKMILLIFIVNIFFGLYQQFIGLPAPLRDFQLTKTYLARYSVYDNYLGQIYFRISGFSCCLYDFFYILSMLFIIILSSWDYFKKYIGRNILYLYIVSYLILLAASLERGPIAMLGLLPIAFLKRKKIFIRVLAILIFGMVALSSYSYFLQQRESERLTRFSELANPFTDDSSLAGRREAHWVRSAILISKNPFGIGATEGTETYPHNNYILIFLQAGYITGFYFIILLISILGYVFFRALNMKNIHYKNLAFGVLAAMIAMIMMGVPNISFSYDSAMFFWMFLAMVEKISKKEQKQELYLK